MGAKLGNLWIQVFSSPSVQLILPTSLPPTITFTADCRLARQPLSAACCLVNKIVVRVGALIEQRAPAWYVTGSTRRLLFSALFLAAFSDCATPTQGVLLPSSGSFAGPTRAIVRPSSKCVALTIEATRADLVSVAAKSVHRRVRSLL